MTLARMFAGLERRLAGVALLRGLLTRPRATNIARLVQLRTHCDVAWAFSDEGNRAVLGLPGLGKACAIKPRL